MEGYRKPIASIYATVMNELIVQQHFIRYSINYEYNPVSQGRTRMKAWMDPFQILRIRPAHLLPIALRWKHSNKSLLNWARGHDRKGLCASDQMTST